MGRATSHAKGAMFNDAQYRTMLTKGLATTAPDGKTPPNTMGLLIARIEGANRGDYQEYAKQFGDSDLLHESDLNKSLGKLGDFAKWQLARMDAQDAAKQAAAKPATSTNAAPATEDISVRRDNFRKSLFKTPSGGDMSIGAVRRKSLLGE